MAKTVKIDTQADDNFGFDDGKKIITQAERVKQYRSNRKLLAKMQIAARDMAELNAEKKQNAKKAKRGRSGKGKNGYTSSPKMQRTLVKVKYAESTGTEAGAWKQQGKYVEREGAEREGEKGQGYGHEGDMSVSETLDAWQKAGDQRVWKLIISPEFGEYADIKQATKDAAAKIEQDLGLMKGEMSWVAIDHYNTAHPHTHMFIRGVAMNEDLEINPEYIKRGLRQRFQEEITNQLGYRTERWQILANERQVQQERFTPLDRSIIQQALNNDGVVFENVIDAQNKDDIVARDAALSQIRRLQFLEQLGLVEKITAISYKVDPNLEDKLKGLGLTKDRDTILEKHRKFMSNPNLELEHTSLRETGNFIAGKVLGAGLDPATENPYLLLEGIDGKAHFVLMNKKLLQERLNEKLPTGKMAIIEVKEMSVVDQSTTASSNIRFVDAKCYGPVDEAFQDDQFMRRVMKAHAAGKVKLIKSKSAELTLHNTVGYQLGLKIEQHHKQELRQERAEVKQQRAERRAQKGKGADIGG